MTYSRSIAVKSEALAVAMSAKANTLDADVVDGLRQKTEEWLDSTHPVFRAVMEFCTHYPLVQFVPDELFARGEALHQALIAENNSASLVDDFGGGYG